MKKEKLIEKVEERLMCICEYTNSAYYFHSRYGIDDDFLVIDEYNIYIKTSLTLDELKLITELAEAIQNEK